MHVYANLNMTRIACKWCRGKLFGKMWQCEGNTNLQWVQMWQLVFAFCHRYCRRLLHVILSYLSSCNVFHHISVSAICLL